ncbi:MAG TPA: dihydrofolate reductase family protein [Streptosporangiaceae bacterium]
MSKVLWHITMSLDGFVAGPDDDMGWLFGCGFAPDPQFVLRTLNQIGALLIGHRTYHGGDGDHGAKTEQGEPYGGAWHGPQFVFTRDDPAAAAPGFTFVGPDIKQAVQTAKDAANGKYVSVLGPGLAAKVLDAGLLDEILVHVAPVLLGDGRRLFDHPGAARVQLLPIGPTPQMTNIWMRVKPGQ